jgi:hypothetical protein
VAESIVRFIAGGAELRNAEVEPSLLSLVCRELNNTRIAQKRARSSADFWPAPHDTILKEFYERALATSPACAASSKTRCSRSRVPREPCARSA